MDTADVDKMANFFASDYPFNVRITEGACPKCFRGGQVSVVNMAKSSKNSSPTGNNAACLRRIQMWKKLFNEGVLDPIQCINAYIPAFQRPENVPKFPEPLVVLPKLGEPCKNNPKCFPRCLLCDGEMNQLPSITLAPWNFPVHECCVGKCGYSSPGMARGVCCQTPVLTVPLGFRDRLDINIRCAKHNNHDDPKTKQQAVEVASEREGRGERIVSQPSRAETPVAHTSIPKKKLKLSHPAKIDRVKEKGCHDIAKMLWPDRYASTAKPEPKRAKIDPPRSEPFSSKGPGATFLYGAKHFDFTEPKRLPTSEDLAHEKNKDEAGPGAGDGEDRRTP